MTKEEQLGVPPMEVMRKLLDENRALVRLLSADAVNGDVNGTEPAETDSADALISAYREVLQLLEILNATSAAATGAKVCAR